MHFKKDEKFYNSENRHLLNESSEEMKSIKKSK
jgi:hypothetical protein